MGTRVGEGIVDGGREVESTVGASGALTQDVRARSKTELSRTNQVTNGGGDGLGAVPNGNLLVAVGARVLLWGGQ